MKSRKVSQDWKTVSHLARNGTDLKPIEVNGKAPTDYSGLWFGPNIVVFINGLTLLKFIFLYLKITEHYSVATLHLCC